MLSPNCYYQLTPGHKQNYRPNTDFYFEKFLFSLLNHEKNQYYRPFDTKADFLTEKQTF